MKISNSSGLMVAAVAVVAGTFVVVNYAGAQVPPGAGPSDPFQRGQGPGQPGMMQGGMMQGGMMPPMHVVNDPTVLYIVRPDRVLRVDKGTMRVTGEAMLPPGGQPGMRPGGDTRPFDRGTTGS